MYVHYELHEIFFFVSKKTFGSRVDQILAWLDLPPSTRPNLYTLYVNQPDNALHRYGRNSKEVCINFELIVDLFVFSRNSIFTSVDS